LFGRQPVRRLAPAPFLRNIGKAPEQLDKIQFKVALLERTDA